MRGDLGPARADSATKRENASSQTGGKLKDPGRDWSGVFDRSRRGRVAGLAPVQLSTRIGFRSSSRGSEQWRARRCPKNEKPRRGERGFPIETAAGGIGGADERPSTSPEYRLVVAAAGKVQEHRKIFGNFDKRRQNNRLDIEEAWISVSARHVELMPATPAGGSANRAGRLARSSPVDYIASERPPLGEAFFAACGN